MKAMKYFWLCFLLLFAIAACAGNPIEARQRFVYWRDRNVAEQENINSYLGPTSGAVFEGAQEMRPNVMEYSFKDKRWFTDEEERCRFIFIVAKDTGTIIGWRYNGKPEYCYVNP